MPSSVRVLTQAVANLDKPMTTLGMMRSCLKVKVAGTRIEWLLYAIYILNE